MVIVQELSPFSLAFAISLLFQLSIVMFASPLNTVPAFLVRLSIMKKSCLYGEVFVNLCLVNHWFAASTVLMSTSRDAIFPVFLRIS